MQNFRSNSHVQLTKDIITRKPDCMDLLFLLMILYCSTCCSCCLVESTSGPLRGFLYNVPKSTAVCKYLGVPYAQPPVSNLRFKPPQPVKPWKKELNCTEFGSICYQPKGQAIWTVLQTEFGLKHLKKVSVDLYPISEDCLTLNIYAPVKENSSRPYPTIIYIHGGSYYMNGGRLYPGEKLASKGAIVVTINYRLGPFGFLSSGDANLLGNHGLLDQNLAIRWVKDNCIKFGGDPDLLTVMGNSAGAASVMLQMFSPLSKGLFSGVIAMSGCSIAPWAIQKNPKEHLDKLAKKLNCHSDNTNNTLECMRGISAETILTNAEWNDGLGLAYAAVVDGEFLTDHPENIIRNKSFSGVPLMMGLTTDEVSIWFVNCGLNDPLDSSNCVLHDTFSGYRNGQKSPNDRIELFLENDARSWLELSGRVSQTSRKALIHAVKVEYMYRAGVLNPEQMGETRIISDVISDIGLKAPCVKELQLLVEHTDLPCYFYEFGYNSADDIKMEEQNWIGAYHESDLQYFFGEPFLNYGNSLRHQKDENVSEMTMNLLLNFALTGDPVSTANESYPVNISWPCYELEHQVFLHIGNTTKLRENYLTQRMTFWNTFVRSFLDWPMTDDPCTVVMWTTWLLLGLLVAVLVFNVIWFARRLKVYFWKERRSTQRITMNSIQEREPMTSV